MLDQIQFTPKSNSPRKIVKYVSYFLSILLFDIKKKQKIIIFYGEDKSPPDGPP